MGQKGRIKSTVANTLYQVLTAPNVGIFTAGLPGIIEGNILRSDGAVPVWSMEQRNVMYNHSGSGFTGCGGKGNPESIGWKGWHSCLFWKKLLERC